jgi:hypothetical protein
MGFDPTRPHRRSKADYFYVAAALAVAGVLVMWAIWG